MKRLAACFIALVMFILPGCGGGNIKPQERLTANFSCDFTLTYEGSEYCGTAEVYDDENSVFTFSSPESVNGFNFTLNGDEYTSQYADITYTGKTSELPLGNILTALDDILSPENSEDEFKSDGDGFYTEGESNLGGYRLYYRADGFPQRLIFDENETTLEFKNMNYAFK